MRKEIPNDIIIFASLSSTVTIAGALWVVFLIDEFNVYNSTTDKILNVMCKKDEN
jgi:hypothetical protein